MLITEMFHTIQGEATFTGTPSLFIRTQGCDVGCSFCDTKFTWKFYEQDNLPKHTPLFNPIKMKKFNQKKGQFLQENVHKEKHLFSIPVEFYDEFAQEIRAWSNNVAQHTKHIVLTGGEPLRQKDLWRFYESILQNTLFRMQLETSGTSEVDNLLIQTVKQNKSRFFTTLSPKIGMTGGLIVNQKIIQIVDEIKFPVGKKQDLEVLQEFIQTYGVPKHIPIWLQPLSQSRKATEICVNASKQLGYHLSLQTHKYANIY